MYQPSGLLDGTHLRFFTYMTLAKLLLDAGFLLRIEDRIRSGEAQHFVEPAAPLLTHCRVHPDTALEPLDTYQYVVSGSTLPDPPAGFASEPITFVACVNDEDQLESNLLRSPCLDPGTPHEVILMRDQTSAADGFIKALEKARHDLVVFAQQDIYLPRGWDSQFRRQFHEAERQLGSVGVAGVFGYRFGPEGKTDLGRVLDRQMLYDLPGPLPARADGLDEIVLAVRRDAPLRFDPALGFHLYGADICLSAYREGLPVAVLYAPLPSQLAVRLPAPGVPQRARAAAAELARHPAPVQQHGSTRHHGGAAGAAHLGRPPPRALGAARARAGGRARPAGRPASAHRQHGGEPVLAAAEPHAPRPSATVSASARPAQRSRRPRGCRIRDPRRPGRPR